MKTLIRNAEHKDLSVVIEFEGDRADILESLTISLIEEVTRNRRYFEIAATEINGNMTTGKTWEMTNAQIDAALEYLQSLMHIDSCCRMAELFQSVRYNHQEANQSM